MGQRHIENDTNAVVPSGILRPSSHDCGQGDGHQVEWGEDRKAPALSLVEENPEPTPERPTHDDAVSSSSEIKAQTIAWRQVRLSLERLRKASLQAIKSVAEAESVTGLTREVILEVIRCELLDWDHYLDRMQTVSQLLTAAGSDTRLDMLLVVDDPISKKADLAKLEEDQGYYAFVLGRAFTSCPYSNENPARSGWELGWMEAREEYGGN